VLVDIVDGVLDGADLLRILVRDLRPELLFEAHDELHEIERVGIQVIDERCLRLDLILVGAELLDDDLLEALVRCGH
jgi:cobalamin biosynthesis protein CobT